MNPCPNREARRVLSIRLSTAVLVAVWIVLSLLQTACQDPNASNPEAVAATPMPKSEARLRVRVDSVRRMRLTTSDRLTGTVRAFHHADINSETQGRVLHRHVEAGAVVEKGQLLIELESSRLELELRRSQASLRAARTVLSHAKRDFARAERLLAQNAMSTQKFDDLQHGVDRASDEIALAEVARDTAKRNLEDTRITAPFSGTVDALRVDVGDFVTAGVSVATLVDLSRLRVFAGVTAREAARLEPGSVARVTFADLGGAAFEATLQSVGRVAGGRDGTYDIELWLDPKDTPMRDGLVAQIELSDPNETPSLLARRAAILRREGYPSVFIVQQQAGGAVAYARRLRTGRSDGEWIEVLDGLSVGDLVVWDGHFALDDGSSVIIDGAPSDPVAAASQK